MNPHQLRPTVVDMVERIRKYWKLPGNEVGGSLHIVVDDGNINDGHVEWTIQWAKDRGDTEGAEIAALLLKCSKSQRKKIVSANYYKP